MQNKKKKDMNSINAMVNDTETSVLATFDFLHNQTDTSNLEGNEADDEDIIDGDNGQASGTEMLNEFDMFLNNRIDLNDSDLPNWKSSGKKLARLIFCVDHLICFSCQRCWYWRVSLAHWAKQYNWM